MLLYELRSRELEKEPVNGNGGEREEGDDKLKEKQANATVYYEIPLLYTCVCMRKKGKDFYNLLRMAAPNVVHNTPAPHAGASVLRAKKFDTCCCAAHL